MFYETIFVAFLERKHYKSVIKTIVYEFISHSFVKFFSNKDHIEKITLRKVFNLKLLISFVLEKPKPQFLLLLATQSFRNDKKKQINFV